VVVQANGDYYDVLGVPRGADKKTIKSAYRQKARKFHPVRLAGASAQPA
jgi:curved DNA-binding protein CbpA